MTIAPPAAVAENITNVFADRGRQWLAALPGVVDDLSRRWRLTTVGPAYEGGTHSYVVPVIGPSGDAVLKVPVLDDENYAEAAALRCYDGDGAVRLYDVDLDTGALLLERAPGGALLAALKHGERPLSEVVEIATGLLRRLRRVPAGDLSSPAAGPVNDDDPMSVPARVPFPRVAELARCWSVRLPAAYDRLGCDAADRRYFAEAAELAASYITTDGPDLIVNRDGHAGNIIAGASPDRPWLLIDPKPMIGDAAFDAGHLLWDLFRVDPGRRHADELIAAIAAGLAVDADRVRGWAYIRAVANLVWAIPEGEAAGYRELLNCLAR